MQEARHSQVFLVLIEVLECRNGASPHDGQYVLAINIHGDTVDETGTYFELE